LTQITQRVINVDFRVNTNDDPTISGDICCR